MNTGQHGAILDEALRIFGMRSDYNLKLLTEGQSLGKLTGRAIQMLEQLMRTHKFDGVVVHGDTTTALAGALAAFYSQVPIFHVEAGMRTQDLRAPFPEELNRQLIARVADLHFAPTKAAKQNLVREGINERSVLVTGNTIVDSLIEIVGRNTDAPQPGLSEKIPTIASRMAKEGYGLVTLHRRENSPYFAEILAAIRNSALARPDFEYLFPVHPNPAIRVPATEILEATPNVHLVDPLAYDELLWVMRSAAFLVTDSGGIQEEGITLGKKTLVLRDVTERPEGIATGLLLLLGSSPHGLEEELTEAIDARRQSSVLNDLTRGPYGDGKASQRILTALTKFF